MGSEYFFVDIKSKEQYVETWLEKIMIYGWRETYKYGDRFEK